MQVIHNIADWQTLRQQLPPTQSIGLVTTMGNLHKGHRSLFDTCQNKMNSLWSVFLSIQLSLKERKILTIIQKL